MIPLGAAAICLPTLLMTTNIFRLPVASWHDNTAQGANTTNAITTNATAVARPLAPLNYSCGCWDAQPGTRWVQLSLRAPTAVYGVEATLGHHFRVNVSTDGVAWGPASPWPCVASPCLFVTGPVLAQHVRIMVAWFDARQDTPSFQGAVLGCRFHVRQGLGGGGNAVMVGLTSTLLLVGRDPLDPLAGPGPPNVSALLGNNTGGAVRPARVAPFNCTAGGDPASNATVAWIQLALGLPPWTPPSPLRAGLLLACSALLLQTWGPPAWPHIWIAHLDLGPSPPPPPPTCPSFLAIPPRVEFQLTVTGP